MDVRVLTKEEFMQQYVLNRARSGGDRGVDGRGAAEQAENAYDYIRRVAEAAK